MKSSDLEFINFYYKHYRIEQIPILFHKIYTIIEEKHLEEPGIYRVAGSNEEVKKLKFDLENFQDVDIQKKDFALLKQYIKDLSETLIPKTFKTEILTIPIEKENLKVLFSKLPIENWLFLKRLFHHLHLVSLKSSKNLMSSKNLAIVFQGYLFVSKEATIEELLGTTVRLHSITDDLIVYSDYIFQPCVLFNVNYKKDIFFYFK